MISNWAKETESYDAGPVVTAKMQAALAKCQRDEPVRRARFADWENEREQMRHATFYPGGSLVRVSKVPGFQQFESDSRGTRGKISGFSRKSRLALLQTTAKLDRAGERPKFVTLTYPGEYPEFFQDWKNDLDNFAKRLERKYPGVSFIWKLEPQERGAPHFHLLVWGVPWMDKEWLSRSWYEIVGSGDERHLRAGTRVENIRSWNGVMCYAGKKYMGKECTLPRNWPTFAGRFWGIYGRRKMPFAKPVSVDFTKRGLIRVHRLMRRYFQSKGVDWKTGGGVLLFTSDFELWIRAFEWADEGQTAPIDRLGPF